MIWNQLIIILTIVMSMVACLGVNSRWRLLRFGPVVLQSVNGAKNNWINPMKSIKSKLGEYQAGPTSSTVSFSTIALKSNQCKAISMHYIRINSIVINYYTFFSGNSISGGKRDRYETMKWTLIDPNEIDLHPRHWPQTWVIRAI